MICLWQTLLVVSFKLTAIATYSFNENLIAVVQLFRHGHRTPVNFYKNDPYSDKIYWEGLGNGQLTMEGKRQQYNLGQFTRRRYDGWLSYKYDESDFYARTTDVERTHMSALSNIYGLYPATLDQRWHPISDWQPIPLHTADKRVFDALPPLSCKSYYIERANYLAGKESIIINEKFKNIYKYISEKSGENITSFSDVNNVFDCLKCEEFIGIPLPKWTKMVYPQPLSYLDGLHFDSFSHTVRLQRLGIGTFLFEVMDNFDKIIANSSSSQKFQMFSGHDYNVVGVLNAFGAYNRTNPIPFATSIYIELRQNGNTYYINICVKENNELKQISIKGCDLKCPISEVKQKLKAILIDTETKNSECQEKIGFINKKAEDIYNAYYKAKDILNKRNKI